MRVAWHEVPGKEERPIQPRRDGFAFLLFPGTSCQATFILIPPGQDTLFRCGILLKLALMPLRSTLGLVRPWRSSLTSSRSRDCG